MEHLPEIGSQWRHRFLHEGGPADGPQKPNLFTVTNSNEETVEVVQAVLGPSEEPEPGTRWEIATFLEIFEPIPSDQAA